MIRQRCAEITHVTNHEMLDRNGNPQPGRIIVSGLAIGALGEDDNEEGDRDTETVVPEVLPAGARRPTAETP